MLYVRMRVTIIIIWIINKDKVDNEQYQQRECPQDRRNSKQGHYNTSVIGIARAINISVIDLVCVPVWFVFLVCLPVWFVLLVCFSVLLHQLSVKQDLTTVTRLCCAVISLHRLVVEVFQSLKVCQLYRMKCLINNMYIVEYQEMLPPICRSPRTRWIWSKSHPRYRESWSTIPCTGKKSLDL